MEYKIITGRFTSNMKDKVLKHFQEDVNNHLKKGWEPLGGVSVIFDAKADIINYYQAVTKKLKGNLQTV